jgi:hypothetical protein
MPGIVIAVIAVIAVAAVLVALLGGCAWREHDRLILLAYRAEQGGEPERQAFEARLCRPGRRRLARWMGLLPRR